MLAPACAPQLEPARDRALRYFAEAVPEAEPGWSYLLPYLASRFGVEIRLGGGSVVTPGARPLLPTLPPFRRLFRASEESDAAAIAALESPIDRMLAAALHCDRLGLPGDWLGVLRAASERGGYALTHAVLATEWTIENGCLGYLDAARLRREQLEALLGLIEERDALAAKDPRAADIWIEALALVHYVGGRSRVDEASVRDVLALQRGDGGWPEHPDLAHSSPHTTAFALWVLLERAAPAARLVPMVPERLP